MARLPSLPAYDPQPDERAADVARERTRYHLTRDFGDLPFPRDVPLDQELTPRYLMLGAKWEAKSYSNIAAVQARALYDEPDGGLPRWWQRFKRGVSNSVSDEAAHLTSCPGCRDAWDDVVYAMGALGELPLVLPPADIAEAVRVRIVAELDAPARPRMPPELLLSVGLGLLASMASLALLGFRLDLSGHPAWAVAAGGLSWTAMFVLAFWMVLRPREEAGSLRGLVASGLGAMAVFMVADHFLPLTKVVQFCYASSWARQHVGVVGLQSAFFVVGVAYAVVPLFLFSVATPRHRGNGSVKRGLTAGGMFFFLLAPAIFIQCQAFTAGALLAWLGGAAVGSTVGGVAGHWLRHRAMARS